MRSIKLQKLQKLTFGTLIWLFRALLIGIFSRERSSTGSNDCFVVLDVVLVVLVSRERSSTGSNDCFVVLVVVKPQTSERGR
jgi:hypothetical protein